MKVILAKPLAGRDVIVASNGFSTLLIALEDGDFKIAGRERAKLSRLGVTVVFKGPEKKIKPT